jgi:hypothetical protein
MNKSQWIDLVTKVGTGVGVFVVAKGWITGEMFSDLLAMVVLIVSILLGLKANSTPVLLDTVLASPQVKEHTDPETLQKLSEAKATIQAAPRTIWLG